MPIETSSPNTMHDTVRGYVGDLLAAHRHVLEAVERHCESPAVARIPHAEGRLMALREALKSQKASLTEVLDATGREGASAQVKEAVTTITGFLVGIYGQVRGETASRMIRDNCTAVSFLNTCAAMLHTTAVAFRDERVAGVAVNVMNELPGHVMTLADLLPHAVAIELHAEHSEASINAAEVTVQAIHDSWKTRGR